MTEPNQKAFAELADFELVPEVIRLLPRPFSERQKVVLLGAFSSEDEPMTLGVADPDDKALLREVADLLERSVRPVKLNTYELQRAISVGWDPDVVEPADVEVLELQRAKLPEGVDQFEQLIRLATSRGASDLHVETYPGDVDVRIRVDGILHQCFTQISPETIQSVVNRLKVVSKLDIAERRRPQDGRFRASLEIGGKRKSFDFRVSIVPGAAGEDFVLRVLDPNVAKLSLADLGFDEALHAKLTRILASPEGLIVVTGPTGSGKTTTLYAALTHINDGRKKIVTAEDPIEYQLPKVNQKQIGPAVNMHELLRALLRHDPDVMLVGEVRDRETASVAISAASTGHLVLATLHTSDAVGSVARLRRLGIDDGDMADAFLAMTAQRLVRKVCAKCKTAAQISAVDRELFGERLLDGAEPCLGNGCESCHHTGYRGRSGVYELLLVDDVMADAISSGEHAVSLFRRARGGGFETMVEAGLAKARAHVTTLDELGRVLPFRQIGAIRGSA